MDKAYSRPTARARQLRAEATVAERKLWQAISARKVEGVRFNRQVPVEPFICDFLARSIRLIIEVDGGQHGGARDDARTRYLEDRDFRVVRFWNHEVIENLDGVVAEIARVIVNMPSPNPSRRREGSFD